MLGLKLPTDPRWTNLAEKSLEDVLTDHAYCEQKAATQCISLIQLYPDKTRLVEEVAPVVTEEWSHFRMVLGLINERGLQLGFQRKDIYVAALNHFMKKGGSREDRLVEKLLVCALIEARSCERFRLLSQELEEKKLRDFYHKFMVSEAGHYRMFLTLAQEYGGREKVGKRWQEYLIHESQIMNDFDIRGDRIH